MIARALGYLLSLGERFNDKVLEAYIEFENARWDRIRAIEDAKLCAMDETALEGSKDLGDIILRGQIMAAKRAKAARETPPPRED